MRTGLVVAWLSLCFCLLAGGGNDLFVTRFHLSINAVTWAVRVAVFVVPVVSFVVTKRICPGLQRRDKDELLHGAGTGVIRRLPHGEYVEVHRPLDAARRHVLGSHEQYRPLYPGPDEDPNGLPPRRTRRERLRMRLSHAFYGPASQVAKPTEEEVRHGIEH
ncbi:hypothetical protein ACFYYN_14185 [Streptomyces sp. NPDC001902]